VAVREHVSIRRAGRNFLLECLQTPPRQLTAASSQFGALRIDSLPMGKKVSEWQVIPMRAKGEYLGKVKATDEDADLKAAVETFGLRAETSSDCWSGVTGNAELPPRYCFAGLDGSAPPGFADR
jgi:hypothetical protein